MSNVKAAVNAAIRAIHEFYPDEKVFYELELEEIVPSEDGSYWLITLGYNVPNINPVVGIAALTQQSKYERKYKVFNVDANTYEVLSMTIREI